MMTHHFGRDSAMPHRAFSLCGKHLRTTRFVHPDANATCLECEDRRIERRVQEAEAFERLGLELDYSRKDAA